MRSTGIGICMAATLVLLLLLARHGKVGEVGVRVRGVHCALASLSRTFGLLSQRVGSLVFLVLQELALPPILHALLKESHLVRLGIGGRQLGLRSVKAFAATR